MNIIIAILAFSLGFLISSALNAATISDLYDHIEYLEGKTDDH